MDLFSKLHQQQHFYIQDALGHPELISDCGTISSEMQQYILPKAKEVYGKVRQDFYYQYYSPNDVTTSPTITRLISRYLELYRDAEAAHHYCPTRPIIAFNRYPKGGLIDPHYDESRYRNAIAIFTITGETPFKIYASDRVTCVIEYSIKPGSLLMLAAPRFDDDKAVRPLHSIGPTLTERDAIVIRHERI